MKDLEKVISRTSYSRRLYHSRFSLVRRRMSGWCEEIPQSPMSSCRLVVGGAYRSRVFKNVLDTLAVARVVSLTSIQTFMGGRYYATLISGSCFAPCVAVRTVLAQLGDH